MSAVVIVHTAPGPTVDMLRAAGFRVEVAGDLQLPTWSYAMNGDQGDRRRSWCVNGQPDRVDTAPTARTVLIVTPAGEQAP